MDFTPVLTVNNQELEVVYSTKILGVIFDSTCKWNANTKYLVEKSIPKLWFLRRLKSLGANKQTLTLIYKLFIRQSLELAAPLWTSSLSKSNIDQLEKIQKYATSIITGGQTHQNVYIPYEDRLRDLSLPTLEERRWTLTTNFARKFSENQDFNYLLQKRSVDRVTRNNSKYIQPRANTTRSQKSPLPTYISILNNIS